MHRKVVHMWITLQCDYITAKNKCQQKYYKIIRTDVLVNAGAYKFV